MIGIDTFEEDEEIGGGIIYKLGVKKSESEQNLLNLDLSKVVSFGCSSICTFILYKSPDDSEDNIQDNYFHYYKEAANGDWIELN